MLDAGFALWQGMVEDQVQATVGESAGEYATLAELRQWHEDGDGAARAAEKIVARAEGADGLCCDTCQRGVDAGVVEPGELCFADVGDGVHCEGRFVRVPA